MKKKDTLWFFIFIGPSIIGFSIFYLVPFVLSIYYSFVDNMFAFHFVWFDNYKALYTNQAFILAFKNTLLFLGAFVPLSVIIALYMSMKLHQGVYFKSYIFLCVVVPMVIPTSAVAIFWQMLFDYNGWMNAVFVDIGVTNAYYPEFHQMNLEGTFFSKYSAGEGVLLSDILVSRLYKSTDVIGKEVEIKGRAYTILGIYNKKDAFNGDRRMQKEIILMDPQGAKAIGQAMTMVDYEVPKAYATQFERRMGDEWRNGIYESQIDMDQRIGIMNQKLYLFLFILGVLTCIELLRAAYRHGIKIIGTYEKGVKNHYRLEAIKRYRKDFIYNGFMMIALVATSLYSFRLAKVDWSILPNRIPKVLTDVDAYYTVGKAMLMAAVKRQDWFNYIGYSTLVINDFFQMGLLLISATLLCINRLMGVRYLVSGKTIRVIFWLSSLTAVAFVYLMKQSLVYDMGLMVIVLYYIVGLGCMNRITS